MSRELFLKLPSIKYFLEKIPSGVFFIEENLIVAEYFRQAKEYGISLKQQCEDLCVPWNSRTIPQKVLTKDLVDASALFSAHDWATFYNPTWSLEETQIWQQNLQNSDRLSPSAKRWVAKQGSIELPIYLFLFLNGKEISLSKKLDNVLVKAKEWHEIELKKAKERQERADSPLPIYMHKFVYMGLEFKYIAASHEAHVAGVYFGNCLREAHQFSMYTKYRNKIFWVKNRDCLVRFDSQWRVEEIKGRHNRSVQDDDLITKIKNLGRDYLEGDLESILSPTKPVENRHPLAGERVETVKEVPLLEKPAVPNASSSREHQIQIQWNDIPSGHLTPVVQIVERRKWYKFGFKGALNFLNLSPKNIKTINGD